MNLFKKIALVLGVIILTSGYGINFDVINAKTKSITYITEDKKEDFKLKDTNVEVINKKELKSLIASESEYYIVDGELINNSDVKSILKDAFSKKSKIIIKDKDLSRNEVRQYFGLKEKNYPEKQEVTSAKVNSSQMVDVSKFDSIGKLIYRDERGSNVTDIKVEANDEDKILEAINHVFEYDYLKLALKKENNVARNNILKNNTLFAYDNSWSNVDVDTSSYSTARCNIDTSLKIDSNDGNPNGDNEYLYYIPYVVDVEITDSKAYIDENTIEVKGKSGSLISAYGAYNQSAESSFSISLPFSISTTISTGTTVDVNKLSGGINHRNVEVEYDVVGFLGADAVSKDLISEAHIESYQSDSDYFRAYGQFHVKTCEYQFRNSVTYYNSTWDYASGYQQ